jgi:hypothetical protein
MTLILLVGMSTPSNVSAIDRSSFGTEIFVDCKDGDDGTGDGSIGSPYATIETALGDTTGIGDWRINIKGVPGDSDYDCVDSDGITFSSNSETKDGKQGVVTGYSTAAGDGTRAVIDGDGTANPLIAFADDYTVFLRIDFQNAGGSTILNSNATHNRMLFCSADGDIDLNNNRYNFLYANDITGSFVQFPWGWYVNNYVHDSNGSGLESTTGYVHGIWIGNIFEGHADVGAEFGQEGTWLSNTFTGNALGNMRISQTNAKVNMVLNNIFEDAGTGYYHIEELVGSNDSIEILGWNTYWNSTTLKMEGEAQSMSSAALVAMLNLGDDNILDPELDAGFMPGENSQYVGYPPNGHYDTNTDINFNSCSGAMPCGAAADQSGGTFAYGFGR